MALKTYSGSCHCGAVRYLADIDLAEGTNRCNCSFCTKARAWFAFVPGAHFRVARADGDLATYQWTPPAKPEPFLKHHFCATCGVRTFATGDAPQFGGTFFAVMVATLDDVDANELAAAPIRFVDGRHDRFDQPAPDTRNL